MVRVVLRATLRLVLLSLALLCAWFALASAQAAHARVCMLTENYQGQKVLRQAPCPFAFPEDAKTVVVLRRPAIEAAAASFLALILTLIALSPKQGTVALYRWRRVVY